VDGFLTSRAVGDVLTGLVNGSVYGLIALSLVLIWRSTHVLNFAQGAMATFAVYLGLGLLSYGVGYWWCVVIALVAGLAIGGVTERVLVRPLYGKPELNPIVVMVGFLIVLESVCGVIWGTSDRAIPTPFSQFPWTLGGKTLALSPNSLFDVVAAVVVTAFVAGLFRLTNLGLQLRASALAPEVARLLGVRVSRMLTLGWMLATAVATVAAVLVASSGFLTPLQPTVMEVPFAVGFLAAATGGLDSPSGAVAAGFGYGILFAFVGDYLSGDDTLLIALGVLVVVLMLRPQGLFTRPVARRV
jgi:branched-chain amino acid transport system permease protein